MGRKKGSKNKSKAVDGDDLDRQLVDYPEKREEKPEKTEEELEAEIFDEEMAQEETREELEKFESARDVFQEFSLEAARTLVFEMKHNPQSKGKIKAALSILERRFGKPVNRQITLTSDISEKSEDELKQNIKQLLSELGMGTNEFSTKKFLIDIGPVGQGEAGEAPVLSDPDEGTKGKNTSKPVRT